MEENTENLIKNMQSSSTFPLSIDQAIRDRFSIPIIVKKSLTFGTVNAQTSATQTFFQSGTKIGDLVVVSPPSGGVTGHSGVYTGYVLSDGVVTIKFINQSTTSSFSPSGVYTVGIFKS